MTNEMKFKALWSYLSEYGHLAIRAKLIDSGRFNCCDVTSLWVEDDSPSRIFYDCVDYNDCFLWKDDYWHLESIAYLYDQVLGELKIDHNLF